MNLRSLAVLLLAFTLTPPATRSNSPTIVAHGDIRNITGSIAETTLFTPTTTGQYRLTLYEVMVVPDAVSADQWQTAVNWYDGAGTETQTMPNLASSAVPPNAWQSNVTTFTTFRQTPITYSVTKSGDPDLASAEIEWTLELMQTVEE